jgi:predicted cobalt transporter CbtA
VIPQWLAMHSGNVAGFLFILTVARAMKDKPKAKRFGVAMCLAGFAAICFASLYFL